MMLEKFTPLLAQNSLQHPIGQGRSAAKPSVHRAEKALCSQQETQEGCVKKGVDLKSS